LSNYEAGRRLEYRIRNLFQRQGFLVIRAAQSKPIDLVCIKDGKTVLVECKAGGSYMGKKRREEILALSRQAGAPIILAKRRKRRVELLNLADGRALDTNNLGGVVTV
jgi:Holliday junction resolvase